ncbi:outer membrane lipoprotein chaperone LolA [Motiliproteus sp. SC1-56]|uniref:outer membrane lipoprotein chaperone LolA n=1 Tax=Motiliproteus sp. SC1-56 TaxID=2799565 RepID=UPI001A8BFBAF|nr:outer membrane lipoprotein chaperone LolA [Motiliproteus sp. SC1-56]
MTRYRFLGLLALLWAGAASGATPAENLNRLLSGFESLSADFEQLVLDSSETRLQESRGQVSLQRPGRFRWRTEAPFPQLLVSDGEQLWLYDEDLEQVTQQSLDQRLTNTPALLLSGDLSALDNAFDIQGPAEGESGVFSLRPRDDSAQFVVMRLYLEAGVPREMQLEDSLGQKTSLLFDNVELNPPLSAEVFTFEVPPGVDLIVE